MKKLIHASIRKDRIESLSKMAVLLVIVSFSLSTSGAAAQDTLKIYDVADLLTPPPLLKDYLFGDRPTAMKFGGGGGGGSGGFGGGGGGQSPKSSYPLRAEQLSAEIIADLIANYVGNEPVTQPATSGLGGLGQTQKSAAARPAGSISTVGSLIIVQHSASAHQQIDELLEMLRDKVKIKPMVEIEIRLAEVASEALDRASEEDGSNTNVAQALADHDKAARVTLRCGNRRIARIAAGIRRSFVTKVIPVVGQGGFGGIGAQSSRSIGYSPEIVTPLLGLFGRVRADVSDDQRTARIHLGVVLASGPEEALAATFGPDDAKIDRLDIETAELDTLVTLPADKWTVAGVITMTSPLGAIDSGESQEHLAVVTRWRPVD